MEKLHAIVRKTCATFLQLTRRLLSPLCKPLHHVFGNVSWSQPTWLGWLRGKAISFKLAEKINKHAAWVALAVILLAVGGWSIKHGPAGGWKNWWEWKTFSGAKADGDKTNSARINVSGPYHSSYDSDGKLKPNPLILSFSNAAGPLSRIGKEAVDVTLQPTLAGKWTWVSASRLEFLPDQDWPIGQDYKVTFGDKAFAPRLNVEREIRFRSPMFEMNISGASFYQDPVQLNLRKAVFEVSFTHAVNTEVFEKHLSLVSDSGSIGQKFTVTYDKYRLTANIHSEPLPIPQTSGALTLVVSAGSVAQRGGNSIDKETSKAVAIPGLYSLDITELKQLIVTGDSGEPENVLQLTAGMPVHEKEMARNITAWLLPSKKPGEDEENYAWSDPAEVDASVLKQSQKVPLTALPAEREITEDHAYKFATEPGRYLLVRVAKGLKSAGGYQLGTERNEILRVKRSAPELSIMSSGSLLALSGEKKLPIIVRDLPGIRYEIGRLLPQQLQHLVTQSQGDISKPEFYNGITPDNLSERFEKTIPLKLRRGKTHYESIDFAEYLRADNSDRRGIFLLSVHGYDPKSKKQGGDEYERDRNPNAYGYGYEGDGECCMEEMAPEDQEDTVAPDQMRDRRLVIVTDLGIVSKLGTDGSRDVFVQSIANGQPVAGTIVEIWARNGSILTTQTTDGTGRAHLPTLNGLTREKAPVVLVVRKGGDMSFLPLNRADRNLDTSRFDVGGVIASAMPNQIQAYLFSDRGIYRPGDTMNIGIVAKSANWAQKLSDLPVEIEVVDARGLVIRRNKLKLGSGGVSEFSHTTQDASPTGNYTVNLYLARDTGSAAPGASETPALLLGSTTVKVQEFMPDRMKVATRLSAEIEEGWISPKDLKAKVNVQNLFGTAAPNRRVDSVLTLSPAYPAFRSHPDYLFFDPVRGKETFRTELERTNTNDQGNVELDLGLQRYAQATYQLHLLVKAFEPEGGRSVAADTAALVSDRPWLIGYKADGDLNYINRNSVRNVSLIAIDPKAKKTAVGNLRLQRLERKVLSVLVKQGNGLYKYESRTKESVLSEDKFAIAASGNNLMLATQTPGNFSYSVRDAQGLELARVDYSVAGTGNVSRSLERNAELQMTLNRKDYEPGSDIEISIRAPYAGAGLITIERDKVYAHKWFSTTNTASVQKITLPRDFEGNGYVSVQFTRDIASNEIYMSPMSHGIVPFATSLERRTNSVTLTSPELIKPGQTARFKLESKLPSKAIVFAVDEGILQVARYKAPDPLKFFFQKRALEVRTQQTLDLILPEFKKLMQAAAPGGDGEGESGKQLNPFKRRTDKPVTYWSGIVDVNGSREFSYTVPESFNGSLRVMAITVNDDTVATASTATTVRGDIVLLPTVPVAITPGDEVDIGVGVANNTKGSGADAPLTLNLSVTGGLEVVGAASQSLKVSEKGEVSTKFRVRAKSDATAELGSASVIFNAQVKDGKARLSTDVSVRPASSYVTLVQTGLFRGDAELKTQANMYDTLKRSEASLSSSPWAFTSGLLQYLEVYPHGCTEQITSQIFPAVILARQGSIAEQLLKEAKQDKSPSAIATPPDPKKSYERYLALVRARQTGDGGFSMWPGGDSDLFATTYVTSLLLEARESKFSVPNDMLQRANVYLQSRLAQTSNYDYEWRVQAQAAYLLTRQGIVTTAALTNLTENLRQRVLKAGTEAARDEIRRDVGAVYLASSYQLLKQEKLAMELLQPALNDVINNNDPWRRWYWYYYYDPMIYQTTTVQLTALHFPAQIKKLPMDYWTRLARAVQENYYQSLSAASMLQAVDAYASVAAKSSAGKVSLSAENRAKVAQAMEVPKQLALAKFALPADTMKLKLGNQGELPLFYSWAESGYEKGIPNEAVGKGLEIFHEYLDASGKAVSEATIGDELTVRVRVRSTERNHISQVALVDMLPGGMEPVLTAPSDSDDPGMPLWRRRLGGSSSWAIEYADIREDRVVFYGDVNDRMTEVTYKVKVTNAGDFVVPAAYGEAMYERRIFARSAGARFKVKGLK